MQFLAFLCTQNEELELNVVSEDVRIDRAKIYRQCVPIMLSSKNSNTVSDVSAAVLLPSTSSSLECSNMKQPI